MNEINRDAYPSVKRSFCKLASLQPGYSARHPGAACLVKHGLGLESWKILLLSYTAIRHGIANLVAPVKAGRYEVA